MKSGRHQYLKLEALNRNRAALKMPSDTSAIDRLPARA
jgi:hypothetical protein